MSTYHTEHYQLSQWERSDKVLMDDFNADNAKLDAALAAKAEAAAVSALAQAVAGKADASDLSSVTQTVSGHTATLSKKGNCEIWTMSYTGTSSGPNTITFPSRPAVAFIIGYRGDFMALVPGGTESLHHTSGDGNWGKVSWSGSTVTITATPPVSEMNYQGYQYLVVALIAKR